MIRGLSLRGERYLLKSDIVTVIIFACFDLGLSERRARWISAAIARTSHAFTVHHCPTLGVMLPNCVLGTFRNRCLLVGCFKSGQEIQAMKTSGTLTFKGKLPCHIGTLSYFISLSSVLIRHIGRIQLSEMCPARHFIDPFSCE